MSIVTGTDHLVLHWKGMMQYIAKITSEGGGQDGQRFVVDNIPQMIVIINV